MKHPPNDQVFVGFFGPGYGECILLHIGDRNWVIIDSCLNDERVPVALAYLNALGVKLDSEVRAVIATHWHDDHIKGLSATLSACSSAKFVVSSAFSEREFLAFLMAHDRQPTTNLDRGGTEALKCMRIVAGRNQPIVAAAQDRIICEWDSGTLSHGQRVELRALSPSDSLYEEFLQGIHSFLKVAGESVGAAAIPKQRISGHDVNDLSIATLLHIGPLSLIFGADVEENGDNRFGWSNIVQNRKGRLPKPLYFKVAHHGSDGAHLESLWNDVLSHQPYSVVTPWKNGGNSLPTAAAKARLKSDSRAAYITSSMTVPIKKRYSRSVAKLVEHGGAILSPNIYKCGVVGFLISPTDGSLLDVTLENGASQI